MNMPRNLLFFVLLATVPCKAGEHNPMLLRQPAVNQTHIVFSYAGDLWTVSRNGGDAKRLTRGGGEESWPVFSPDGTHIAFTGQYHSWADVYVIPAAGGTPRRLTYHPTGNWTVGWTPNGKSILFGSWRNLSGELFTIPLEGGFATKVPLCSATVGTFSPDGRRMAYLPLNRRNEEWKLYRGGGTTPVWIAELADSRIIDKIPRNNSNDFNPMWVGRRIYFLSDRLGPVTLFAYDMEARKATQVIRHVGDDINSASMWSDVIVYEQKGGIYLIDVTTGKTQQLQIRLADDLPPPQPQVMKVAGDISAASLSPTGSEAVFEARGELMIVSAGDSRTRNLTNTPGARERFPAWSPDEKYIAYFSDESGEYALHVRESTGEGKVHKIELPPSFYFSPVWSPDSKKIAYQDKRLNLWFVELKKEKPVLIDTDTYQDRIASRVQEPPPTWSPDSRWLSYAKLMRNGLRSVYLYSLESGRRYQLTDGLADVRYPQFDNSGKYIYFAASTDIGPTLGGGLSTFNRSPTRGVYVLPLRKSLLSPLTRSSTGKNLRDQDMREPLEERIDIDFENLQERIIPLPIPRRNYSRLVAGKQGVLYLLETVVTGEQRSLPGRTFTPILQTLYSFDLHTQEVSKIADRITNFDLSQNGEKMLYGQERKWVIRSAGSTQKTDETVLDLDSMQVHVNPGAEWKQMYREVWRTWRDFFYDPGHHGLDLEALERKYQPYLDGIVTKYDLDHLFLQMMRQLSVSHLSLRSHFQDVPASRVGLLGADYRIEKGRYKFARIYSRDPWDTTMTSPLTESAVSVRTGEYLLAVNGRELRASDNIYGFFDGTAGKPVTLRLGQDPSGRDSRDVTVTTLGSEYFLRYFARIEDNRRRVDHLSDGRVAYVPLPDTGGRGYASFNRYFFAQRGKQAVIIDARANSGGALADYVIDNLRRQVTEYGATREGQLGNPGFGPKVMIIDEYNYSGGDHLPYLFRRAGLGLLIGKRTAGGLVRIGSYIPLMDGGVVTAPDCGIFTPEGEWVAENRGIAPDIEVDQDPQAVRAGHDPQLERAVEVVLQALKKYRPPNIKRPSFPRVN